MSIKTISTTIIICLVGFAGFLTAQVYPVELTLDNAIELALEQSHTAKIERLNLIRAEQGVKASKGRFRTQIDMTLDAPEFRESVSSFRLPGENTVYNTVGSLSWSNNLTIRQPLPTAGSVSLRSRLYQTRESVFKDELDITDKDKQFLTSLRLSFDQPLFVPNDLKLGLEDANLRQELAQRGFQRTELNIVYRVTEAFYDLYRAKRRLEIAGDEVKLQEESYNLAQRKYEAGLIPEVDALQMEVDLAGSRNDLFSAEGDYEQEKDRFKLAVGLSLSEEIDLDTDIRIVEFDVDEEKAVDHGMRYRSEIREREIASRLAEITLEQTDAESAIRGNIGAYYDLTGVSDPTLEYGNSVSSYFRSSWNDLRRRPRNKGITFTLSLPIWDSGVNRARVEAARANLQQRELDEQDERRQVALEIRAVITRLKETRNRLDVLKKSEAVALRGYEITQARFDNGDITSQDLADNQKRLTNARQAYLDAFIAFQLAVADLKRNTLYDWENDRSLVNDG